VSWRRAFRTWLRQLLVLVLDDEDVAPRMRRAPAAKTMHHAFLAAYWNM